MYPWVLFVMNMCKEWMVCLLTFWLCVLAAAVLIQRRDSSLKRRERDCNASETFKVICTRKSQTLLGELPKYLLLQKTTRWQLVILHSYMQIPNSFDQMLAECWQACLLKQREAKYKLACQYSNWTSCSKETIVINVTAYPRYFCRTLGRYTLYLYVTLKIKPVMKLPCRRFEFCIFLGSSLNKLHFNTKFITI